MSKPEHPYIKARVIEGATRWYVAFSAWDVSKNKLIYKRLFDPLNRIKNIPERRSMAAHMIREINKALEEGKVYGTDAPIQDNIKRSILKFSLLESLQFVIDQKQLTNHRKNYIHDFKRLKWNLEQWLKDGERTDFPLAKFTDEEMYSFCQWIGKKKLSNKTFNNYRTDLATVFNFLMKRSPKLFEINPALSVGKLPVINRKHAALSNEEMIKVKELCETNGYDQLLLFIRFVYYTFGRPNEVIQLKVENVDLATKRILFPASISKSKRDDYVGIPPAFYTMLSSMDLQQYPKHFYLFGKKNKPGEKHIGYLQLYNRNCKIFEALGLYESDRQYSVYSYKHSGVIALYLATKDIKLVQAQCRHESLEQTNKYLRDLDLLSNYDGLSDWTISI